VSPLNDSEDLKIFLDDFVNFLEGLEASIVKMKQQIVKLVGTAGEKRKWGWNPDAIKWVDDSGPSGQYQRSEDVNNPEFKKMLSDLAEHNGKLTRDGVFYWVFRNGSTVGRKRKEAKR